jgi:hypothetical protein
MKNFLICTFAEVKKFVHMRLKKKHLLVSMNLEKTVLIELSLSWRLV